MSSGHWLRARSWLQCGAEDDCTIKAGEPYLLITLANTTKARCQRHAGRELPADWETRELPAKKPLGFSSVGTLAKDWKRKQSQADE